MTTSDPVAAFAGPTAAEVLDGVDLSGRRALVTGATSGIGLATASAFAAAGADVVVGARDTVSGLTAAGTVRGSGRVTVGVLDLADLDSVRAFVRDWDGPLDILVNNAGIMAVPDLRRSPQGHELQLATNHLGHFALATGLEAALAASGSATVVAVSSAAHRRSPVVLDDIDFERRDYDPWIAYGQSKTANILFAVAAATRWAPLGIRVNAAHPGSIVTNLGRFVGEVNSAPPAELKTAAQGAATSVHAATRAGDATGQYFVDERIAEASAHATDPQVADALWAWSERAVAG